MRFFRGYFSYFLLSFGGMEGALLSAALSGVGMIMQNSAADDAAAEQQRIINQAAEEEAKLNQQKANTIENFTQATYNPLDRTQRYEKAATQQESSLVDSLLKANGGKAGEVSTAAEGNLSSDYTRAKGAATAAATEDILKRARLMSRLGASGLMYNDEALKGGQLSSDVAGINSSINRTNTAAQTRLGGVRNQGSLVGGLMSGLAPAANKYVTGKSAEWDSMMNALS